MVRMVSGVAVVAMAAFVAGCVGDDPVGTGSSGGSSGTVVNPTLPSGSSSSSGSGNAASSSGASADAVSVVIDGAGARFTTGVMATQMDNARRGIRLVASRTVNGASENLEIDMVQDPVNIVPGSAFECGDTPTVMGYTTGVTYVRGTTTAIARGTTGSCKIQITRFDLGAQPARLEGTFEAAGQLIGGNTKVNFASGSFSATIYAF